MHARRIRNAERLAFLYQSFISFQDAVPLSARSFSMRAFPLGTRHPSCRTCESGSVEIIESNPKEERLRKPGEEAVVDLADLEDHTQIASEEGRRESEKTLKAVQK